MGQHIIIVSLRYHNMFFIYTFYFFINLDKSKVNIVNGGEAIAPLATSLATPLSKRIETFYYRDHINQYL